MELVFLTSGPSDYHEANQGNTGLRVNQKEVFQYETINRDHGRVNQGQIKG